MKDKILVWLDYEFSIFGAVKSLQEKYDAEFFAVIDSNEMTKKYFQNQKMVTFEKTWFLRDEISKITKPNLEYLESFEKKYQINIWSIVYSERAFYPKWNKYHRFDSNEILCIIEQECRLYEKILDEVKPNFLICRMADYHHIYLFQELAKSNGIQLLILGTTRLGNRVLISKEVDKIDDLKELPNRSKSKRNFEELQKYIEDVGMKKGAENLVTEFQNSTKSKAKAAYQFFFKIKNEKYREHFNNYGRTRTKVFLMELNKIFRSKIREDFLNRHSLKKIEKDAKFVYFPMHFDPERQLLIKAPFYTNQLEFIINLAKSLPVGYELYVKEHPLQKWHVGWKPISQYKTLIDLPNVKIIHPSVSSNELIKKSSLVVTISGTSVLEAAFYNKPGIIVSDLTYAILPSVYKLNQIDDLPNAIRTQLKTKVNADDVNKYIDVIEDHTIDFRVFDFHAELVSTFYYGGEYSNVEIPIKKMNVLIEKYKESFDRIASKFVEKIKNKVS